MLSLNAGDSLDRIFIDTLKAFEPLDARMLEYYRKLASGASNLDKRSDTTAAQLKIRPTLAVVSIGRLVKLGCLSEMGGAVHSLSALGQELIIACKRNGEDDPPTP